MLLDSLAGPGCGVCGSWGGVGGFGADLVERRHRLGGFVVQKYLESHAAPAGVLLASFPQVDLLQRHYEG